MRPDSCSLSSSAARLERRLQFDESPCHHALASEEREDHGVVAREQGADLVDAHAAEVLAKRRVQLSSDSPQPPFWPHLDREDPAAGRRAELPGADFADDEALDRVLGLRHEECALLAVEPAGAL